MNKNTNGFILKKRTIKNRNIFGLTKKGEYKYKYEYLDWFLQNQIQTQVFVTHYFGPFRTILE